MQKYPLFALILPLLMGALAGNGPAQESPSPLDREGPSPNTPPQKALDYMVAAVNDWGKKHPLPDLHDPRNFSAAMHLPRLTEADVETLANQAAPFGLTNLLIINHTINHTAGKVGDRWSLLMRSVPRALSKTIQDGDLPELIEAVPDDPDLSGLILGRPAWKDNPKAVSCIEDEMERESGYKAPSDLPLGQTMPADLDLTPDLGSPKKPDLGNHFSVLMDQVITGGNPALLAKLDSILEDAGAKGDRYSFESLRGMVISCCRPDYRKYLPGLLTSLCSEAKKAQLDQFRSGLVQTLYGIFMTHPELRTDPNLRDPVMQLAAPLIHDESFGENALCLQAAVGDADGFSLAIRKYADALRRQDYTKAAGGKELLDSITYQGPADKLRTVKDHLDLCHFETKTGCWTLVAPGFEGQPPHP